MYNWWCWYVCKKRCAQEFGYFVDVVNFTVTSAGGPPTVPEEKGVRGQKSLKTTDLVSLWPEQEVFV